MLLASMKLIDAKLGLELKYHEIIVSNNNQ